MDHVSLIAYSRVACFDPSNAKSGIDLGIAKVSAYVHGVSVEHPWATGGKLMVCRSCLLQSVRICIAIIASRDIPECI